MFCKQCGKRLEDHTRKCPYCGNIPEALSGGSGFWNMTTPPTTAPTGATPVNNPVANPVVNPVLTQEPASGRPMADTAVYQESAPTRSVGTILSIVSAALTLILLIVVIFLSVRVRNLSQQVEDMNSYMFTQEQIVDMIQQHTAAPPAPQEEVLPADDPAPEPELHSDEADSVEEPPEASPVPEAGSSEEEETSTQEKESSEESVQGDDALSPSVETEDTPSYTAPPVAAKTS